MCRDVTLAWNLQEKHRDGVPWFATSKWTHSDLKGGALRNLRGSLRDLRESLRDLRRPLSTLGESLRDLMVPLRELSNLNAQISNVLRA